jgi:hypothetical protein
MEHSIEEAAIRLPDGKVITGFFHGHCLDKAADAGYADEALEQAQLGFSAADGSAFYEAETFFIEG